MFLSKADRPNCSLSEASKGARKADDDGEIYRSIAKRSHQGIPPMLLAEARKAESEGVALNHLITLALAEKVSAMRTQEYFVRQVFGPTSVQLKSLAAPRVSV